MRVFLPAALQNQQNQNQQHSNSVLYSPSTSSVETAVVCNKSDTKKQQRNETTNYNQNKNLSLDDDELSSLSHPNEEGGEFQLNNSLVSKSESASINSGGYEEESDAKRSLVPSISSSLLAPSLKNSNYLSSNDLNDDGDNDSSSSPPPPLDDRKIAAKKKDDDREDDEDDSNYYLVQQQSKNKKPRIDQFEQQQRQQPLLKSCQEEEEDEHNETKDQDWVATSRSRSSTKHHQQFAAVSTSSKSSTSPASSSHYPKNIIMGGGGKLISGPPPSTSASSLRQAASTSLSNNTNNNHNHRGRNNSNGGGVAAAAAVAATPSAAQTEDASKPKSQAQIDRRRERNRILARRTRLRKKFFFESLQKDVSDLQRENAALKSIVRSRLKPDDAKALLSQCNANEKLPNIANNKAAGDENAGGNADVDGDGVVKQLDKEDFNLISSIQNSQQCFIITDPSLHDNPIVYASDDFLTLTGYSQDQVLGRNCRFLQGNETSQEKVALIRKAVTGGEDVSVTFANYKSDGTPFWNNLFIAALRDADNNIVNFIGVIVKVDGPEQGDAEYGKVLSKD
mmetsp:Transcript_23503/g.36799  ORF Transcript_23503/g.36799 Transcript_23503/m.36799 type:complete len:566 (+) Transcript_23503:273-1970(+)